MRHITYTFSSGRYSILVICLSLSFPVFAEDSAIGLLFEKYGVTGTMVIASQNGNQTFTHNEARSNVRFAAASTFKILNSLIALEEGIVSDPNDIIKWNGKHYDIPEWNRDQTLESAFKVSCVWCYQQFAQGIGADKYREYIKKLNYGQLREPFMLTEFWLDGALQISAVEQVEFLRKVYMRVLPFSSRTYDTLKKIMRVDPVAQNPGYRLWAKSGWATRITPQVGWYVGYIVTPGETPDDVWYFATNLEIRNRGDLALRQHITLQALKLTGVIN